ncbi:MAG: UDP-N-acetylglucosamine 2-epimerase, partial [Thermoproteota archaeon]|nr:UDP-N-acetylglucosamine 2-epimerase [Thermoproteota archaeon]
MSETESIDISNRTLPVELNKKILTEAFENARAQRCRLIAIVIGTKPDFYKQAPLIREVIDNNIPAIVIDTGQHFDDLIGFGIKEFSIGEHVACNLKIRGDLVEKASDLIIKFAKFGRICKTRFPSVSVLPIVHGDTLVAGIAPLAWTYGLGQKVAQNEAGLRSMAPDAIMDLRVNSEPCREDIESFVDRQFNGKWFIAREEPYPEQIDTWICSAGTQYFFAPTEVNKQNLIREGYPEASVHVVGNSRVDAINLKRKEKPHQSIFDLYSRAEIGDWIRVDIHRRENLTKVRFSAIIEGISDLVKLGYKVLFIKLNATQYALNAYGLGTKLDKLADSYPDNFIQTPLWKEYGHVVEFLDSGHCWAELTDSGSMQEELMYFPDVLSLTARLNTDRPETIFQAKG